MIFCQVLLHSHTCVFAKRLHAHRIIINVCLANVIYTLTWMKSVRAVIVVTVFAVNMSPAIIDNNCILHWATVVYIKAIISQHTNSYYYESS